MADELVRGGSGTNAKPAATGTVGNTEIVSALQNLVKATNAASVAASAASGAIIPIAQGGTGQITAVLGFDALSPLTTRGDVLYRNATSNTRLAAGTSGQFLKTLGSAADPAWADAVVTVTKQTFAASGTYTPTTGMLFCIIEAVGGGAGGGGCANSGAGLQGSAGGGGGGSYAWLVATAATIGASKAVTIGAAAAGGIAANNPGTAGNDTSVGVICIGKGGSFGAGAAASAGSAGGAGGVAGTGDFSVPGEAGRDGSGATINTISITSGDGGTSGVGFGAGGRGNYTTGTQANGGNYGGGGSGGLSRNANGACAGGIGAQGVVRIIEFVKV